MDSPPVTVDWKRLKAVVLESDDWGLCGWVPDEAAHKALERSPAFRTPAARVYGRSTLETEADVARLVDVLQAFQGADGFAPVWQANTVVGTPDFELLASPRFRGDSVPLLDWPEMPSRWRRPFLAEELEKAQAAGVWWPELHGLHHVPDAAWRAALRGADDDARRALAQQCLVCEAVAEGAEYDPEEPAELRRKLLEEAVRRFYQRFKRMPTSFCPPDYRWDDALEKDAESLGLTLIQGRAERPAPLLRLRRWARRPAFQGTVGKRFYMPARIAFEPRGESDEARPLGVADVHARIRDAWAHDEPAVVSSHRVNYAHLDPAWSAAGRTALRDLLARLAADQAIFLTDAEVRGQTERGWSLRPVGPTAQVLRRYVEGQGPVRFPAPPQGLPVVTTPGRARNVTASLEGGEVAIAIERGECLLQWGPA